MTQTPVACNDNHRLQYEDLRDRGNACIQAGRLVEARECFRQALDLAVRLDDRDLRDRAVCSLTAIEIELEPGRSEAIAEVREILVRGTCPFNCWLAAYTIARFHELNKEFKKAAFYARVALGRAESLGNDDWRASSHNLLGNALLAESRVVEAFEEYTRALKLGPESPARRGRILDNLGYCMALQGDPHRAVRVLRESLRLLRSGADGYQISTRLDLCFALLEIQRLGHAHRHGRIALDLARKLGDTDSLKNALFLLGEVAFLDGREEEASRYFQELQRDHYPDSDFLPGFLLSVDVRTMVNLHA